MPNHRIVSMMDETRIIQQVLTGDGNAYEQLVNRYHIGLIIHCDNLLHDRDVAEDIAQEAFIKAYTDLQVFNADKGRFSTWLYRIATNKAIDYLRSQKRQLPHESVDQLVDESAADFEQLEQCQLVRDAVTRLEPPTHRQVIEAYYWHGKSYQEIAIDLNVPINTVRTWLRRAKAQLGKELV